VGNSSHELPKNLQHILPILERVMGIEPTSSAWKAEVLPLNYTRLFHQIFIRTMTPYIGMIQYSFAPRHSELLFGVQKS
jgi:hypothetical protein